ncbi:HVO_2523 family zinc finger protein [Halobellus clavatus]|uniref:HVO_2523 family zinc finger protein n=1 Tax=Halobellus clavatus TaxID=660517 RepID=UPI00158749C3|nr:HVO_2523 family zinc finger protein [Halobellus clavatus]
MSDPGKSPNDDTDRGVESPPGRPCPFCERSMARRHCKYVCPEHGVVYDCSDTFW